MLQTQASNGTNQSKDTKNFSFSGTLNCLGRIDRLPEFRFRWNSNEEVFTILTSLEEHQNWVASEVKIRPPNGSQLIYNRNNLKTRSYHNDKYFWKTRKNSKSSARVDHSSLRIRGIECIYCSYVHSALVPTFHRRCYWLLENPDIVLVHYLNIPDKKTTFDDLVTSLLPYKKLTEQELLCQLQPVLTRSEDEGNNNTIIPVDVKKLISEVKNYKEPKTKRRTKQKKTPAINKQVASSTSSKPSETLVKDSHVLNKCSNCNRFYTTNCSSSPSLSRTNVAVTINRQTGTTSRSKHPVSNGTCYGSAVHHSAEPCFATACLIPHGTSNQDLLTTDSNGHNHPDQIYPCHDVLHESPYPIALHNSNNTSSNSCHGSASLPVTSQENSCVLDKDLVVFDYDGMNLVQSSQSDNDLSKAFDISIFENDILHYLPDYLPEDSDLQPTLQNSPCTMSTPVASMTKNAPDLTKMTLRSNIGEETLRNDALSNQIGLPSYSQYFVQQSNTMHDPVARTPCSPTPMITTDCHTFNNATSSVLQSNATNVVSRARNIDDLVVLNGHQCPLREQTWNLGKRGHVFQMGVSEASAPELALSAAGAFQENVAQMSVPQFGVPLVDISEVGRSNVGVARESVSRVIGGSKECISSVETNVAVSQMDVSTKDTAPIFSRASTQSNADQQTTGGTLSGDVITEFSPEWSYCDGKSKVLILGDWSRNNGPYSCLFDGCPVPATLIQPGVLRCFSPPHEPGLVALQVAWNGFIISNACVFEYKKREVAKNSVSDWLGASRVDMEKLILERIERLESILGISAGDPEGEAGEIEREVGTVEDRLVSVCEVLLGQPGACLLQDMERIPKGLTLLHLAAGLGYIKLIRLLQEHECETRRISTANEGDQDMAETAGVSKQFFEWSPRAKDSFGCTPLMWACWHGHEDVAMTLLAWQPSSYSDCDHSGRSAKVVAQEVGHLALVKKMEEFMRGEDMYSLVMESSPQSPSSSCAYLSVSSNEQVPQSPMSADSLTWERVEGVSEPSAGFEIASLISEERPNTLGKVLVEIRALIQQAEERARSPLQTPSNSAPFSLGFAGFSDLPCDEGTSDNRMTSDADFGPRTPHYDTLSIDSSPIRTPSSHSPGSPSIRNSPQSTGTDTSEFEEFLSKPRQFLERDFSELTLTDIEQQELLQAAKIIQDAYRQFKIRKKQHVDELKAAVLIQSYYRRYKQFALYRRITKAAVLIQNSYRAHKEHEQFKRSRHAAAVIQTYFRHYRKRKQRHAEEDAPGKRLGTKYRKPSYGK